MNTDSEEVFYLLPYTVEDVMLPQAMSQVLGWHISAYNLPSIWEITQGEGVKIAIIDSGCDLSHPDLKNNLIEGKNFVEDGMPPEDSGSHGTHVAGIVAGYNTTFHGVAPKAKIIAVNVFDPSGGAYDDDIIKALKWVYSISNDYNIAAINMSLGTSQVFTTTCNNYLPEMTTAIAIVRNNIDVKRVINSEHERKMDLSGQWFRPFYRPLPLPKQQ